MNDDLLKDIEECKLDFEILQGYEQLQEYNIASDRSELLDEKIETCIHIAEISNRREKLFEARITDYSVIFKIKKQFKPFL
jgi:mRNA-degrading endonuclease RelE of RelBE toxin-antitoxin system